MDFFGNYQSSFQSKDDLKTFLNDAKKSLSAFRRVIMMRSDIEDCTKKSIDNIKSIPAGISNVSVIYAHWNYEKKTVEEYGGV